MCLSLCKSGSEIGEGIVTSYEYDFVIVEKEKMKEGVEESLWGVFYVPFRSVFTHEKNGEDENFPEDFREGFQTRIVFVCGVRVLIKNRKTTFTQTVSELERWSSTYFPDTRMAHI